MEQLVNDHVELDHALKDLRAAIHADDSHDIHERLDLFWARLAVHIRAEHLHLFPTIVASLSDELRVKVPQSTPSLSDAQTAIENLRTDHDFFMKELGRAIAIARELVHTSDAGSTERGLNQIRDLIAAVEKRLVLHNEAEENHIYRWATTILDEQERVKLANEINAELTNLPPRFNTEQ
jgi:hemerythrin superfamily protein